MARNAGSCSALFALLALSATAAGQDAPPIERLGDERFRIGSIVVDKAEKRFTVPATILHLDQTLEYLAVTRGGYKGYESLLEIDATAHEFQLACILIGFDDAKSVKPRYQFDDREALGQAAGITLSWTEGEETRTVKAANALLEGDEPFDDHSWVYVGSIIENNGELMAETIGTLIGFVHDPYSIIDHRFGAGVGAYGLITGNGDVLPPEGSTVTVTISASGVGPTPALSKPGRGAGRAR